MDSEIFFRLFCVAVAVKEGGLISRISTCYCNFIVLSLISYGYILPTRVMAEIWEHGNITTTKSDEPRNTSLTIS